MALVPKDGKSSLALVVNSTDADGFKIPLTRSALKLKELPEETYVAGLQKIIERDFFPDLPVLRAKHEFEAAVSKGDLVAARKAQMSLQRVLRGSSPRHSPAAGGASPGAFSATSSKSNALPSGEDITAGHTVTSFTDTYTSEDTMSSSKLLLKAEQLHSKRLAWHDEKVLQHTKKQALLMDDPQLARESAVVVTWVAPEKNNTLFTVPSGDEVLAPHAKSHMFGQKAIQKSATRIDPAMLQLDAPARVRPSVEFDLDRLRSSQPRGVGAVAESPRVGGFGFVATPSPMPGVDSDPVMTWGDIAATPQILHADRTPGPAFKIAPTSAKEQALAKIVGGLSTKGNAKAKGAKIAAMAMLSTPSPMRSDSMLRASYTKSPSPARSGGGSGGGW
jgi:protein DGCR14